MEKSFIGGPIKKSYGFGNGFILDIKTYDFDKPKCQYIDMGPIFDKSTSVKFFNLNNEYLKHKKFTISSHVDVANPSIFLRRNTILTFPLDRKFYVNISGSYTLDYSDNSILPVDPTPYTIGVGLSFNIRKILRLVLRQTINLILYEEDGNVLGNQMCNIILGADRYKLFNKKVKRL